MTTDELQRLQNLEASDYMIGLFMGIYGVGKNDALQFVMQGYRTLEDVREMLNLRIGIELYDVHTRLRLNTIWP